VRIQNFLVPPPGYWELTVAEKAALAAKCAAPLRNEEVRAGLLNFIQGGGVN
jgi:hypothetical protein